MGALDYLSNFCTVTSTRSKRKALQVNRKQQRVTVSGYVEPNKVLKRVKSTGKRAELWPYVPQHLVTILMHLAPMTKGHPPATFEMSCKLFRPQMQLKTTLSHYSVMIMLMHVLSCKTVDIKVKMDCDGCERRVKNAVTSMKGYIVKLAERCYAYIENKLLIPNITLLVNGRFSIMAEGGLMSIFNTLERQQDETFND
ncbi:heavy metal-associated isoprenylated plant protein 21 [Quercus suber]|uniref:Heavy metal-associated isoprenylated plant protein 21 n=1 Tax=Quercus suber TaxID=58331 RepID=A0AAW0KT09_QUESU